jgi:hypothetical protein
LLYVYHNIQVAFSCSFHLKNCSNFNFPETWNQTSQKMSFKICSSVLGWPPNRISFPALHIPYTTALRTRQHSTPNMDLVFHWLQPSSIKSDQSIGGFKILHRCIQVFHIREQNPQPKNKWVLLSVPWQQKRQVVLPLNPQDSNLSPVVSSSWMTEHPSFFHTRYSEPFLREHFTTWIQEGWKCKGKTDYCPFSLAILPWLHVGFHICCFFLLFSLLLQQ